jgi:DNA-binding XRE family transcriptional regulator
MVNHPNRSGKGSARNPKPAEVKMARNTAGLSQTAAGEMVHVNCQTWQQWENDPILPSGEKNPTHRRMHPAFWELFQIKVKELGE